MDTQKDARKFRCTLLNRSAWSTEKKYMRRNKGTFDILFGIEQRIRKEEMEEEQFTKKTRKDGGLQGARRESQMRVQTVKIISTRQEEWQRGLECSGSPDEGKTYRWGWWKTLGRGRTNQRLSRSSETRKCREAGQERNCSRSGGGHQEEGKCV